MGYISVYISIRWGISDTDSQYNNESGFVPYQLKPIIQLYCNILRLTNALMFGGIFIFLIKELKKMYNKDVIDDNLKSIKHVMTHITVITENAYNHITLNVSTATKARIYIQYIIKDFEQWNILVEGIIIICPLHGTMINGGIYNNYCLSMNQPLISSDGE